MKSAFFLLAILCMVALIPALYAGWLIVAHFDVPFISFTILPLADLAVMCWAFSRLERLI